MNSNKSAGTTLLAAIVCIVAVTTVSLHASPIQQGDQLPIGPDGSLFLAGTQCGPDEVLAPGALPTCEPTCRNPKPVCQKIFFASMDFVPCFCKKPLVRNTQTKQCVPLSECPPKTQEIRIQKL